VPLEDKRTDWPAVVKAVGSWPWRLDLIRASAGKVELSTKMAMLLALTVFDAYELFPAHDTHPRPKKPKP
jgi:hypothetical protein